MQDLLISVRRFLSLFETSEKKTKAVDLVMDAIRSVDRKDFLKEFPYEDSAMPIGYGQTISQPSTAARMLMLADIKAGDDALEIGSGSGWNASLMGYLCRPGKVLSLDIIPELVLLAEKNTSLKNVRFKVLNIFDNMDNHRKKYDKILITAGIDKTQESMIDELAKKLLKDDGVLVCPYEHGPMIVISKKKGQMKKKYTKESYLFVPLIA